jgi:hypothetical protein
MDIETEDIQGYVYFVLDRGLCKIGKTKNLKNRMGEYTKLPYGSTLYHCINVSDRHKAEIFFHERYADKRLHGEWFNLLQSDLEEIKLIGTDADAENERVPDRTRSYYRQRLLTNSEFSKPLYNFLRLFWIPMALYVNPFALILVILHVAYFKYKMKQNYPEYYDMQTPVGIFFRIMLRIN